MRAKEFIVEYKEHRTEEFHGLNMKLKVDKWDLTLYALDDWDNEIGHVSMNIGDMEELDPQDLYVKDKYRGQGVAKVMYDYLKSKGYEIHRSPDQTDDGKHFWDKNRGEEGNVWEEINPDIEDPRFKHEVEMHGYHYTAESENGNVLIITVYDGDKKIADTQFVINGDSLESSMTWVSPSYQGQNLATNMYAYAKMLGNDIVPSDWQTDAGNRMWRSWNQSGQSKHILPKGHKGYRDDY